MKKSLISIALFIVSWCVSAQTKPIWLMNPSISPDGSAIAFGYKGHLYTVNSAGGIAQSLTVGDAYDQMPVWSHDGKSIAFASDRYGDFDVFVIPAAGGQIRRLTYYSGNDFPVDFTADDKNVVFLSARNAPASSVRFSISLFKNLYTVSTSGGRPVLLSAAGMERARYNSKGTQIVFEDIKGYEDAWRKHATSAVTRDVWMLDIPTGKYKKISNFDGEDREPVFSSDDQNVFYLSERNGTQNVYKQSLSADNPQPLTSFKDNPVRYLSRAANDLLCFTWNGEIYTLLAGGQPKKVDIRIASSGNDNIEKNVSVTGNISEFAVSPNGKEIAFVNRGEVFVTSASDGETKRVTNTPQQERMVEWAPDGRSLIYATERGSSWDIYRASILRKDEPYFYASTVIKEEPVIATEKDEFQPKYSPDGNQIAYIEERNMLKVYNITTRKTITILPAGNNYSYADGDWDFSWSPDSRWLIFDDSRGYFASGNTAMAKADGSSEIFFPVNSGFGESNAKWAFGGKAMLWQSNKLGRKSLANQGSSENDVYAVFFDKAIYEQFRLSKEDYALLREKEKDSTKSGTAKADKDSVKELKLDLSDLEHRQVRLTINSSSVSDYALSSGDSSKLYYLAQFEKGYDLWETNPRTHNTKILAKLGSTPGKLVLSKDGKTLFLASQGGLMQVDTQTGKAKAVPIRSSLLLDRTAERKYIFEHAWRQVKKKLYDPALRGIDWDGYKKNYERFLPHINNNYDFQVLLSEFLGELDVSHSGGRYYPENKDGDQTAALGLLYDETYRGRGLKITEVVAGGPMDVAGTKVKPGDFLVSVDGEEINDNSDWNALLNHKAGKNTLLSFSGDAGTWDEVIRPVTLGVEAGLMYKRWTDRMAVIVDKLSNGRIGYVHVQGMNDASFRETVDKVMGKEKDKDALIVDTRFNGGGWLHDDLATFLSGKNYLKFAPQGHLAKGGEPLNKWQKPSCVLMSESNYSDAFIFPYVYRELGIGKLIGMPVAGTGTAVWWERQIDPTIVFGIPMVATIGKEKRPTEGLQIEPDIRVALPYNDFLNGRDNQLEAAVKEMLKHSGN